MNEVSRRVDVPALEPGAIHIFNVPLEAEAEEIARLFGLLSADERERAERFRFERHRRRFVVCRGRLRVALARYLSTTPERVSFKYQPRGKPELAAEWSGEAIEFNVSHSHELAVFGFCRDRPLGLDVEHLREMKTYRELAQRFFAVDECQSMFALAGEQQPTAFFRCWTRKEAMLKAFGTGLTFPLNKFVVTLGPDEPAQLLSLSGQPTTAADWWLESWQPTAGYISALAWQGPPAELVIRTW